MTWMDGRISVEDHVAPELRNRITVVLCPVFTLLKFHVLNVQWVVTIVQVEQMLLTYNYNVMSLIIIKILVENALCLNYLIIK